MRLNKVLNSCSEVFTSMIGVSDELIRSVSHGEVSFDDTAEEGRNPFHLFDSAEIFGEIGGTDPEWLGHIELPVPVINIQYLMGTKPVLAKELQMKTRDLYNISIYLDGVVVDPKDSRLSYKQVLPMAEYNSNRERYGNAVVLTGAKAVMTLLEKEDVEERQSMVLNTLPVLPICMRWYPEYNKAGEVVRYTELDIYKPYEQVLISASVVKQMEQSSAAGAPFPYVVTSGYYGALQRRVNSLINNGADGHIIYMDDNNPCTCLQNYYDNLHSCTQKYAVDTMVLDKDAFLSALNAYGEHAAEMEGKMYSMDDPAVVKSDELAEAFCNTLRPAVACYITFHYPAWKTECQKVISFLGSAPAENSYALYKAEDEEEKKYHMEQFFFGLARAIDIYFSKYAKWESAMSAE